MAVRGEAFAARRVAVHLRRVVALLIVSALLVLGVLSEWRSVPTSDVGWLLHVTQVVARGGELYRDVFEINPPLIVWLKLPLVMLAEVVGVNALAVYRVAVLALMLACGWGTRRLVVRDDPVLANVTAFLAVVFLAVLPIGWFGEREHLLVALVLPYVVLAGAAEPRSAKHRAIIGALAGLGIALKPQHGLVWVGLMLRAALAHRGGWRRAEHLAAGAVLALYAVSVPVLAPGYLPMVREIGMVYLEFRRVPLGDVLLSPAGVWVGATLGLYLFARIFGGGTRLGDALAVAAAGLLAGVVIQGKGFPYHFYPAVVMAVLVLGTLLVRPGTSLSAYGRAGLQVGAATLLLAAVTPMSAATLLRAAGHGQASVERYPERVDGLRGVAAGRSVLSLSPQGGDAFLLVAYDQVRWVSRFPSMWMLSALYRDQLDRAAPIWFRPIEDASAAEQWLIDAVIADAVEQRPDILLIYGPQLEGENRIDCLAYFRRDPRFRTFLAEYEQLPDAAGYRVFIRRMMPPAEGRPAPSASGAAGPSPRDWAPVG